MVTTKVRVREALRRAEQDLGKFMITRPMPMFHAQIKERVRGKARVARVNLTPGVFGISIRSLNHRQLFPAIRLRPQRQTLNSGAMTCWGEGDRITA